MKPSKWTLKLVKMLFRDLMSREEMAIPAEFQPTSEEALTVIQLTNFFSTLVPKGSFLQPIIIDIGRTIAYDIDTSSEVLTETRLRLKELYQIVQEYIIKIEKEEK
ncbi:MAG: hypothetical protein KIH08_16835 [Candidatus Freyarchaeota archaeon]|nr:hypothetical protein [Candidatus Jordarchaeia archaeon]